jgi:acetylornithine/N-succinyldiaminopimelate aminotransferase
VFFCSTGAEANEGAIKLARKYGALYKRGAYEIITTKNGFHGRTLATMSATGKAAWEMLFEPKVDGFRKSVFNDIDSVKALIGDNTCAVMIEPVQGEGGVHVADPDYIMSLRQVCDEHGILLIFDEIQTGMGRTGKLFCYEHYGIVPDIMTLGKGIGGGFPLSALLTREKLNIFDPGDQGGTYSGQPLAMAAGKAVLKALFDKKLVENAAKMGRHLINALHEFAKTYAIENIRGKGLLVAFDLAGQTGQQVVEKCIEHQLLINSPNPGTIRLMPPLIVSPSDVDAMLSVLEKVICKKTEA